MPRLEENWLLSMPSRVLNLHDLRPTRQRKTEGKDVRKDTHSCHITRYSREKRVMGQDYPLLNRKLSDVTSVEIYFNAQLATSGA